MHLFWQPGVVGQTGGALRGSSQELRTIQVLLLAAAVCACEHIVVQVFPEGIINIEVALLASYVIGIDLEGGQNWAKQSPKA